MRTQVRFLALLNRLRIQQRHELWCRSRRRLGPGIAVAVVSASGYSSNSTPSLGTSKERKKESERKKGSERKKVTKEIEMANRHMKNKAFNFTKEMLIKIIRSSFHIHYIYKKKKVWPWKFQSQGSNPSHSCKQPQQSQCRILN